MIPLRPEAELQAVAAAINVKEETVAGLDTRNDPHGGGRPKWGKTRKGPAPGDTPNLGAE